ncbi:hypothetical protein APTSU1_001252000 [Apodemus speciosus]|uniref:Uncharacterized protein n=1 Tax=Apodemus speciosus TaxID=105296 RepID=A0ABQ0FDG6_APOSI
MVDLNQFRSNPVEIEEFLFLSAGAVLTLWGEKNIDTNL